MQVHIVAHIKSLLQENPFDHGLFPLSFKGFVGEGREPSFRLHQSTTAILVSSYLTYVLGRRMSMLFEGGVSADSRVSVPIEETELAPGNYIIRMVGPDGVAARLVTKAH